MGRVARLLIYEGPADKLDEQIARSIGDGVRTGLHGSVTLRVITLPPGFLQALEDIALMPINEADVQPISGIGE